MRNRTDSEASESPQLHKARRVLGSARPKRPRIEAAADEATLYVYDYVGWLGVEAEPVLRALDQLDVATLHVRINSPGGDVFDGMAIYNAVRQHPARVVVHVDGLAASIASVIALAGDEIRMSEGSFFMIHNPWTVALGDAAEMRKTAEVLDKVGGSLAGIYASRTGEKQAVIQAVMDEETWYTAQEAVDAGFADVVEKPARQGAPSAAFDLSVFDHAPRQLVARTEDKQTEGPKTIREFETWLRDAGGFSHAEAKAIASRGYKAPTDPREGDDGRAQLVAAIERRGAAIATLDPR